MELLRATQTRLTEHCCFVSGVRLWRTPLTGISKTSRQSQRVPVNHTEYLSISDEGGRVLCELVTCRQTLNQHNKQTNPAMYTTTLGTPLAASGRRQAFQYRWPNLPAAVPLQYVYQHVVLCFYFCRNCCDVNF